MYQAQYWLDEHTRLLMIEFAHFNLNMEQLTAGAYIFEIGSAGYVAPSPNSRILKHRSMFDSITSLFFITFYNSKVLGRVLVAIYFGFDFLLSFSLESLSLLFEDFSFGVAL